MSPSFTLLLPITACVFIAATKVTDEPNFNFWPTQNVSKAPKNSSHDDRRISEAIKRSRRLQEDEKHAREHFLNLASSKEFVDKSLLIEYVVSKKEHLAITAPIGFGKSLSIIMLKEFLEVQVDHNGTAVDPMQKDSWSVFKRLKIGQNAKIFDKHFSKYPVMYMNMKTINFTGSKETFTDTLRAFLMNLYKQHEYLWRSKKLGAYNKELLRIEWETLTGNGTLDLDLGSAQSLSQILYEHFNKRCIVLIDDLDWPAVSSLLLADDYSPKVQGENLNTMAMMLGLTVGMPNDDNILYSFSTGVTSMSQVMSPYVDHMRFIDSRSDPEISRFYGFSVDEVRTSAAGKFFDFKTVGFSPSNTLKAWYGGYPVKESKTAAKEITLYNPNSVLKYASNQDQRCIIGPIRGIDLLKRLLAFTSFGPLLEQSLGNTTDVTLKANYLELVVDGLKKLKSKELILQLFKRDALLQYLMENGFYSRPTIQEGDKVELIIPNIETEMELVRNVYNRRYFKQKLNISEEDIQPYIDSIVTLRHNDTLLQDLVCALTNLFKNKMPSNEKDLLGPMYSFLKDAEDLPSARHERVTLGKFTQAWDSGKDLIVDIKDGDFRLTVNIGLRVRRQSAYVATTELLDKDIPNQAGRRPGPYLLVGLHLDSDNVFTTSCISADDYHNQPKKLTLNTGLT